MRRRARLWLWATGLLLIGGASVQAAPPAWLLEAARQPTPPVASDVPAVVLLDEIVVTIDAGGRASTTHRQATRILTRAGLAGATARVSYREKSDSVRGCDAWLIRGGKAVKISYHDEWADVIEMASGSVYDEFRARILSYTDQALTGDIFGYETRVNGPMLFSQLRCDWSGRFPSIVDRYQLQIPPGWTVNAILKGPVTPVASTSADGRVSTWELRDRPYHPDEPSTPARDRVEACLLVNLSPPVGGKAKVARGFANWAEVTDWSDRLNAGQCDTNPALVATVGKLTAGCPDNLAKIRALASYVQELRYVAVSRDLGIGFGFRARKATEIHAKGWGDCKDKANLLRAMLREAGIRACPALAQATEGLEVFPDWPSPTQFNHAIVAIEVDDTIQLPATVPASRWGRLLFFDPTDADTVLGDLPRELQGSQVLICATGSAELTTLPTLSVEAEYLIERRVTLSLSASGAVSGKCSLGGTGQAGAWRRGWLRKTSAKDLREKAAERLSETLRGVSVTSVTPDDDRCSGRCTVTFEFSTPHFAQLMRDGLALVRLDVLSRDSVATFPEKERRMPVEIRPMIQRDEVVLELPAGFTAEELPPKATLVGPYGSYENTFTLNGGSVVRQRVLQFTSAIVPVSKYADLQKFLSDVARADRTAVVLRKTQ